MVLEGKAESYSSFMQAGGTPIFAILAPIKVGKEIEGAILTCHKVKRQRPERRDEVSAEQKPKPRGLAAKGSFSQLPQSSNAMQVCIHQAKLYAQWEEPVPVSYTHLDVYKRQMLCGYCHTEPQVRSCHGTDFAGAFFGWY